MRWRHREAAERQSAVPVERARNGAADVYGQVVRNTSPADDGDGHEQALGRAHGTSPASLVVVLPGVCARLGTATAALTASAVPRGPDVGVEHPGLSRRPATV
ncbi:hypothetical protein [Streptomyces sp. NBC_01727]|uniref:hypothetical protein n=1 Tax=Streptomyces sp. NBC_01727 TaxID=2975924 RepID=UPI002E14E22C|nr:hypothetical protein OIE76_05625 [Streptomyces sp. NBC_01727]